jgi:hypothetical protein
MKARMQCQRQWNYSTRYLFPLLGEVVKTGQVPHTRRVINESTIEPETEKVDEWAVCIFSPEKLDLDISLQLQGARKIKHDIGLALFNFPELHKKQATVSTSYLSSLRRHRQPLAGVFSRPACPSRSK